MEIAFRGFPAHVFSWFAGLEQDNSREYFSATRERYETDVRGGLHALLDELSRTFGGSAHVFRQQRDLRFTADRTPYKSRTYGLLTGSDRASAGLYAELSSQGLYAGSGYHRLARDQLERYRGAVADDATGAMLAETIAGARESGLEVVGASMKGPPRGFARDHPRLELLRHTALIGGLRLPGRGGIGRAAALDHVAGTWQAAQPLTSWLDDHVGTSRDRQEGRRAGR